MAEATGRLSLVVFAGDFAKVHYALAMAAAALSIGRPATLFFTMGALQALVMDDGWRALPGAGQDAMHAERGIGRFEELLDAVVALGGTVMACEMGLRAMGIDRASLRPDVPIEDGGLVTFLNQLDAGGTALFV